MAAPSVPRIGPGQADAGLGERVVGQRLHHHDGAEAGDEHGRARGNAFASQLEDMAHLVHEQQQHEPGGELPAEEQAVGGDGDQRGAGGRQELDFRQQQEQALDRGEELGDRRADRREHAADALAQRLRARAALRAERIGRRPSAGAQARAGGSRVGRARGRTERPVRRVGRRRGTSAGKDRQTP